MRVIDLIHGTQGSLFGSKRSLPVHDRRLKGATQSPAGGIVDGTDNSADRQPPVRYYFDSFCVDPINRQLMRDGQPIPLTPLSLNALLFLIANSGRLVPRGELLATIWPDTSVEDPNLAVMILS